MEKWKSFLFDIFISASIGLVVGGFYLIVLLSKYIELKLIIKSLCLSGLIGVVIGAVAKSVFTLLTMNVIKNTKLAYIIEGIIIMSMTAGASYIMAVRKPIYILIMSIIAVVLGFVATYSEYRSWKISNKKLKEYQNKLGE